MVVDWYPYCTGDVLMKPSKLVNPYRSAGMGLFMQYDVPKDTFVAMIEEPLMVQSKF